MNLFTRFYFAYLKQKNSLDYAIRQKIHFDPRPVSGLKVNRQNILLSYPHESRELVKNQIDRLNTHYHFADYSLNHSTAESKENYFYLSMLDKALQEIQTKLPETLKAADIGPSSWFYVHALTAALTWYGSSQPRSIHLAGYEVDAYRLYSDFRTRKDHALGNMLGLSNVEYIDHGFSVQPAAFDVITLFFPFVFEKDHLQWGLPGGLFDPAILMKAAWDSLRPNGLIVIVNQGINEHQAELKLLDDLGIPVSSVFRMDSLLFSYPLDRYVIMAQK